MFESLKTFFGFKKQSAPPAATPPPPAAQPAKKTSAPPPPTSRPAPAPRPTPSAAPKAAPVQAAPEPPSTPDSDESISLPLKPILAKLPSTLSALVKSPGNGEVSVPLGKVMKQLPQGSVKITFGELRTAAPMGTFLEVASQDQTLVELPLPEILSRINPGLLTRRTPQKVLDAPAEVGNLFGNRGETLPQPSAAPTAPSAPKAPVAPAPSRPAAPPSAPAAPRPVAPAAPIAPISPAASKPIPAPSIPKPAPSVPVLPKPAAPTAPKPTAPIAAPNIPRPAAPIPAPKIPMPSPAAPKMPEPAPAAVGDSTQYFLNKDTVSDSETITVSLASLIDAWPEPVKEEIKKGNLLEASVAFPMAQLEVGLKAGKISYPWKQIASWVKPNPPVATLMGETIVELPLKVIAPLFIQHHRPVKAQKKVSIGENIPDIFSGGAPVRPAAAPAPAAAPIPAPAIPKPIPAPSIPKPATPIPAPSIPKPTAAPIPSPSIPKPAAPIPTPAAAPAMAAKEPATMGEVFGQPDKKDWSPNEVVQKTSSLKGVSGAMIVTTDGLLVAGLVPAPYKADTIGAFLPQIFVRMNQYGKELQVGEVNSLQLEFNKIPWYIVKLGHIYFGAVGKVGEAFPTSLLKVIASELEKPTR